MGKNYQFYGIKRSGNHAVINWLIPQIGVVRFFNDQKYVLLDVSQYDDEHGLAENILRLHNIRYYVNNIKRPKNEGFENESVDVNNLFSFEGVKVSQMLGMEQQWISNLNKGICKYNNRLKFNNENIYIILLRNPWNIMASQLKWRKNEKREKNDIISDMQIWDEFYDYYIKKKSDTYLIIYDKWFTDVKYRKSISGDLGLEFTDVNLNEIPKIGGGSSFDKVSYDGQAQKMNVLNRYDEMLENDEMRELITSDIGIDVKKKWNRLCEMEGIEELNIK